MECVRLYWGDKNCVFLSLPRIDGLASDESPKFKAGQRSGSAALRSGAEQRRTALSTGNPSDRRTKMTVPNARFGPWSLTAR